VVTFQQLQAAKPGPYEQAAETWRGAARVVRERADDLARSRSRLSGCWGEGAAEQAAHVKLARLVERLDAVNGALMSLDQTLCEHADGIRRAQAMLAQAGETADAHGVKIGPDGSVTAPTVVTEQVRTTLSGVMQGVSLEIGAAVRFATDLDADHSGAGAATATGRRGDDRA
jgi:uncharacterized protein YukE